MKKPTAVSVADEPIGIVIATGNRSRQSAPQVRAYFWYSTAEVEASLAEDRETN